MARRIQVLPDIVANQIAAGEVVERPASVVKELVENALDAKATRIEIQLERGGKRRIRVSDDGTGMGREDALLAFDRHSTSKIRRADDLRSVRSFGFRGEALPSIAAVSRLVLETQESKGDVGSSVRVSGGTILGVDDSARQPGTTVDVQGLFFNAPARSKFLKGVAAETKAVSEVVTVLALANPRVAFSLSSDGRVLHQLPGRGDIGGRIDEIWGHEAAATLIPVQGSLDGLEVKGLVQRPDAARPGFRRAQLFVNGRPFRDPTLIKAVERAYRTTIPGGVRPWIFLYLSAPEGSVDVNVHPAKAEVRFRDREAVEGAVEASVRSALGAEPSSATFDSELAVPSLIVREGVGQLDTASGAREAGADQMALFMTGPDRSPDPAAAVQEELKAPDAGRPRLWQALHTYILAETREGIVIIDQHSAHERVLFERMMTAFAEAGMESQRLLFPLTLKLGGPELRMVEDLRELLRQAGFEVEAFGGDALIVHSVPNPHPWFDAERCLREMITELTRGSDLVRAAGTQHERIAMTFACKGAIKAGQRLDEREMQELFDALFSTELPHHDVHGRPTVIRLSSSELERKFGRH